MLYTAPATPSTTRVRQAGTNNTSIKGKSSADVGSKAHNSPILLVLTNVYIGSTSHYATPPVSPAKAKRRLKASTQALNESNPLNPTEEGIKGYLHSQMSAMNGYSDFKAGAGKKLSNSQTAQRWAFVASAIATFAGKKRLESFVSVYQTFYSFILALMRAFK